MILQRCDGAQLVLEDLSLELYKRILLALQRQIVQFRGNYLLSELVWTKAV